MTVWILVGVAAVALFFVWLVLGLCRAAALGDRMIERSRQR